METCKLVCRVRLKSRNVHHENLIKQIASETVCLRGPHVYRRSARVQIDGIDRVLEVVVRLGL